MIAGLQRQRERGGGEGGREYNDDSGHESLPVCTAHAFFTTLSREAGCFGRMLIYLAIFTPDSGMVADEVSLVKCVCSRAAKDLLTSPIKRPVMKTFADDVAFQSAEIGYQPCPRDARWWYRAGPLNMSFGTDLYKGYVRFQI